MAGGDESNSKEREMVDVAGRAILARWAGLGVAASEGEAVAAARCVLEAYVTITPPEETFEIGLVTMYSGGRGGGRSRKPGNVLLNIGMLVGALAKSGMALVAACKEPWIAVLAALVIWNEVWSKMTVEISEREAIVLWSMWMNRDAEDCTPNAQVPGLVASELKKFCRPTLTSIELVTALRTLERIGTIEKSRNDPTVWWLREWVRGKY